MDESREDINLDITDSHKCKKAIIAFISAILFCSMLCLSGCGSDNSNTSNTSNDSGDYVGGSSGGGGGGGGGGGTYETTEEESAASGSYQCDCGKTFKTQDECIIHGIEATKAGQSGHTNFHRID